MRSNATNVIVVDSVAALIPKAEIEGEMGDSHVGLQARLMSQAMRKLTGAINRSDCTVIFINQIREKIGVMFGSPETTTGGRALKFYSSVRIDIRRIGSIKDGDKAIGNHALQGGQNKIAPPFQQAEFDIMFNEGISWSGDLLDLAVIEGICQKSGAWFSWGDVRMGQGRETAAIPSRQPRGGGRDSRKVLGRVGSCPSRKRKLKPPRGGGCRGRGGLMASMSWAGVSPEFARQSWARALQSPLSTFVRLVVESSSRHADVAELADARFRFLWE